MGNHLVDAFELRKPTKVFANFARWQWWTLDRGRGGGHACEFFERVGGTLRDADVRQELSVDGAPCFQERSGWEPHGSQTRNEEECWIVESE